MTSVIALAIVTRYRPPEVAEKESIAGGSPQEALERWWQDHSELDRLVDALLAALGSSSAAAARAALEELREAMHAHFSVEEDVYFPLVERLSPRHAPEVRRAATAHDLVRSGLDEIQTRLGSGDLAAARSILLGLLAEFRRHEEREANLIADLTGSG